MDMDESDAAQRLGELGELVRRRRKYLGLTQEQVAGLGGPSTATLRNIENGSHSGLRAGTASDLDRALSWPRGTTTRFLSGQEPLRTMEERNFDVAQRSTGSGVARGPRQTHEGSLIERRRESLPHPLGEVSSCAERAGIYEQAWIDVESGAIQQPSAQVLARMAKALAMRPGEFAGISRHDVDEALSDLLVGDVKTGSGTSRPLDPLAAPLREVLVLLRPSPHRDGPLFTSNETRRIASNAELAAKVDGQTPLIDLALADLSERIAALPSDDQLAVSRLVDELQSRPRRFGRRASEPEAPASSGGGEASGVDRGVARL